MYEHRPITELEPGRRMAGRFRGVMSETHDTNGEVSARIILETKNGPVVVGCDDRAIAKLKRLNVSDGHQIILMRLTESVCHITLV